jgi:hypothetical protein
MLRNHQLTLRPTHASILPSLSQAYLQASKEDYPETFHQGMRRGGLADGGHRDNAVVGSVYCGEHDEEAANWDYRGGLWRTGSGLRDGVVFVLGERRKGNEFTVVSCAN